jgi:tetratricopeptide (TPR) repeat protein
MNIPGRNDPCPCGSGLKYKKCCMTDDAAAQESDQAQSLRAYAFKDMSQENWLDAIDKFKALLEEISDPHTVLEAIASCYDGLENYLMAAEYYEKALAVCPEPRRLPLHYHLGVSRGCAERIEKAVDAFQQCLELQSDPASEKHILQALDLLRQIQEGKRAPNTFFVQIQMQRAFTDMEADNYESAAARLERLAGIDSENAAVFYNLGVVYTFLKREDDALTEFQRSVDLYPDYYQAWYNMGQICLIKTNDISRAFHCFDRATAIRPDYIGAHHQKGTACELLGDKKMALECWEKTLELDPENKQAKDNIRRLGGEKTGESCPQ